MRQIYIVLTKKCNLTCDFCIRDYTFNKNNSLDLDDVILIFDEIKKTYYVIPQIILSGGEPTLLKHFHEISCLATQYFKEKVVINSNGTTDYFLSSDFKLLIEKESITVQISIDGSENFHDAIRGKGSFNKSVEIIKYLSSLENVKVVISTTVSDFSFGKDFETLRQKIIDIPFTKWDIKRVSYSGRGGSIPYLKTEDWNRMVDHITLTVFDNRISITKQFDFSALDAVSIEQLNQIKPIKNCGSGTQKIYIYPNLDVLSCTCYEKYPSGNLKINSLSEILASQAHKRITNDVVDSPICNDCRYKSICNGGCLGSGFSKHERFSYPDIKCPKVSENL